MMTYSYIVAVVIITLVFFFVGWIAGETHGQLRNEESE